MKCLKCRFENPEDSVFCLECGTAMEIACPACGKSLPAGAKFCNKCGRDLRGQRQPLPRDLSFEEKIAKIQRYLPEGLTEKILSQRDRIEGERKQVTVMFCDMEGFSLLTERLGPEEAYTVMDDVYEILIHKVHDYEGTVNEMTGDGIVALFGAPIALEDAPQRAIRSAMAIHREMVRFSERLRKEKPGIQPVKMRIGIHTGPVVVGTLGNDLRVDFKAVGDTVNLASRMEELAAPGSTCVTEASFKLTEGLFRFEALGRKQIKGREEPVTVYQVLGPSTRRTRFDVSAERGLTPFVGRERELELLLDGFERAKTGRGQAFSIVAEAGLGKSRLLYEFRKAVTNEDMTFLEGRSLSYSRGIAYHPVIDMLKSNFDIRDQDGVLEIGNKVKAGLETIGADPASTLPYLLDLLSIEENGIERMPLSPETRKARIIEALKAIVLKGSEVRPLIMAFEDLHWVDRSSEDVFKSLLDSIPGARVLLMFTYRPEFVHTWGAKSFHSHVTLNRLSNRETLFMVTHLLDTGDIDPDLEHLILEKTEGVPFFIEEFLKSLKELKIIERKDTKYCLAKDMQEVSIPSTVQDVIMARVDSLPEGTKDLLQLGSVIDREFSYELIKRVAGLPEQELLSRLSGLRDSELLYERGVYPQSTYVFKHALTQEVAYNSLLAKKRNVIHEEIGEAVEELYSERLEEYYELLAYHYVRSHNRDKALEYLDLANQKANKANAIEEAKTYFDVCMGLADSVPDTKEIREKRISLLVNQANVFTFLIQTPEYYELLTRYESLAVSTDNAGLLGAFYVCRGQCEYIFGRFDKAIETTTKAVELCETAGDDKGAAHAYALLAHCYLQKGDLEKTLALKEEALRKMGDPFDPAVYVRALNAASAAWGWRGRFDEAIDFGQKGLEVAQRSSDNRSICQAAYFLTAAYLFKGDLDSAVEYGELAVEKAPTSAFKVFPKITLAWARCRAGEVATAIASLDSAIHDLPAERFIFGELYGGMPLCEGYWLAGEYAKARGTLEEYVELTNRCGTRLYLGYAHRLLGEVSLKADPSQAIPHFDKAISIFKETKAENHLALAYSGLGRYYKQQGNVEDARKYLTEALEIFERLGTLLEPDQVRKDLAELPQ